MTPLAHISSGYLIYTGISGAIKPDAGYLLGISIAGAIILDIDGLFGAQMKDHRSTVFHAPLFWLTIFIIAFIISLILTPTIKFYILAFFLGILSHLFLDWFSGRTAGIKLLYPFSKKTYALFPIRPEMGKVSVLPNKQQANFWKFYLKNKFLVILELIIVFSPCVCLYGL